MKKFFALLLSACLFISCGINEFSKKSTITFTIPTEALVKLQSQARDVFDVEDYNPDTQNPVVEEVTNGDSGSLTNEVPQTTKFLVYAQLKGSKKGYYKSVFKEVAVSSDDYDNMFARSIIYNNEEIQADNAEISFSDLPVNQTYDIYVDIFSFTNNDDNENVNNIGKCLFTGSKTDVSLNAGDNNVAITMNDAKDEEYNKFILGTNCSIKSNGKTYSEIGKYMTDSGFKYYLLDYGTDGSLAYCEEINQDCQYEFTYEKIDRFPEIKLYPKEYDLENEEYIEIQFKLGDYYLPSGRIKINTLEENPEGETKIKVLPIDEYFEIIEDSDKFIFSRDDLFNQTSVTYLIDTTNELTIDDVKTSLNFNDLTQDGVEIPDANSFTLWLFVQSGIEGTYYFNLTFEKENDEWIYYTNEEKEYLPISTYFDLIINKDDEGNYYPTVELQSKYSEKEGFSNFDSNKIKIFVVGGDNNIAKDVVESSNSMFKNFSFNNNLIYSEQLFTIAFATKIDSNLEYFKSVIECNISSNPYKWLNYDDASLKIINKTATESIDETSAGSFIDDENNPKVSLEFTKDPEGQRYRYSIPLSDVLDEGKKLTDGDTIAFVLNFEDSNLTYFKDEKFYYQLRPSVKNTSGENVPDNLNDQNNYCVDVVNKTKGKTTLVLPINKLSTKIKGSDDSDLDVEYLQFYFDGQNINAGTFELKCSVDYFIFPVNDEAYVFALTKNYDGTTQQNYPYRYEISEFIDLSLQNGNNVRVTLEGELYTIGYNESNKQFEEKENVEQRNFITEIFDSSASAGYYKALSQDTSDNIKDYNLNDRNFNNVFKYGNITNCSNASDYKFQCYSTCYNTEELLVLKHVKYQPEIYNE